MDIASLLSFFSSYGYFGIFALGVLEEVVFFIPSGLLFLAFGVFGIPAEASFIDAFIRAFGAFALPGALGVLFGSFMIYGIAYWGGKPAILRFGGKLGISWQDIERVQRMFGRGYTDEAVLVFARAVPVFPISIISALCGVMRIRPVIFALTTFAGSFIRVGSLSLAGWYAGKSYVMLAAHLGALERYVLIAIALCIGIFMFRIMRRKS